MGSGLLVSLLCFWLGFTQEDGATAASVPPTWASGIKSLVTAHCASCHRPDGAAPFSLNSPNDFRSRRTFVSHVLKEGLMPPWLPTSGVPLEKTRGLSTVQRDLMLAWLKAGCPPGSVESDSRGSLNEVKQGISPPAPKSPPVLKPAPGVLQESPSMTLRMRAPWTVPAEGGVRWFKAERDKRTFVLPIENPRPLRVRALDYQSTAPQTLGAVALSADPSGDGRTMVDWDEEPGSYMMADIRSVPAGSLGIIGPGGGRLEYPKGFYVQIPIGSDILSEVHYRPQGRDRVLDDLLVLETLGPAERARPLVPVNLMVPRVRLDPGERKRFANQLTLPVDIDLVAMSPRASRRCVSLLLQATFPDAQAPITLLEVADWNPHYRSTLVLEKPLRLPAGTVVHCAWGYDNSAENPRNPVVPPEKVDLGARSGAMNVLLMSAPVNRPEIRPLLDFIEAESRRNRG